MKPQVVSTERSGRERSDEPRQRSWLCIPLAKCGYAAASLVFVSGCATWDEVAHDVAQPWRASSAAMARVGDRVSDLLEFDAITRKRNPENLPAHQAWNAGRNPPSSAITSSPINQATAQTPAVSPTISQPAATQAIHNTPAVPERPPESTTVPLAPPAVELLPAPPITPISAQTPKVSPAQVRWCRVRIRNVGQQPATQVAVTVSSPANAPLFSKHEDAISAPTLGPMKFAPVAHVGVQEEVVLMIGVGDVEHSEQRLRIQVHDSLGGSNLDAQARWHVELEAIEAAE